MSICVKLSKSEKKSRRKMTRFLNGLAVRSKVDVAHSPTVFIMVTNAGLTTESRPEQILELFLQFATRVEDIVMPVGESHCFLRFGSVQDSMTAMNGVHGIKSLNDERRPISTPPLYLAYVHKIPDAAYDRDARGPPPGLIILKDVVTEDDETLLLNCVRWDDENVNEQRLKHRRVKHYGYEFRYDSNDVDREHPLTDSPIPQPCLQFLSKLFEKKLISFMPDQLTVNQYQPGQGIASHVDTHSAFRDEILSLSLGSDVTMDFRLPNRTDRSNVLLPRKSLAIMTGASRFLWSHGITPRKTDVVVDGSNGSLSLSYRSVRTSFTFRTVRREPCRCQYAEQCDSQRASSTMPLTDDDIRLLEDVHVYQVYDNIAEHFSDTRHKAWSRVEEFIRALPVGSLVLDVGCGNGKYLAIDASTTYKVGCDRSENLMTICSQRGFQGVCCDALLLPFRSDSFDACLCIAVIHHLANHERRANAIAELIRVLKPDGRALVYVWSMEQTKNDDRTSDESSSSSNYISPSRQRSIDAHRKHIGRESDDATLPVHVNRTHFESQDVLVPWHLKPSDGDKPDNRTAAATVYHRYYHVFRKGELEKLCTDRGVNVVDSYYDKGNWCAVLQKIEIQIKNPTL